MYNENTVVVTVESLATAISAIPDLELKKKESLKLSHRILNYFGYGGSVNDFILERDMRGIFYMLEDAGLLTSHSEETVFYDRKRWTLFFWTLKGIQSIRMPRWLRVISLSHLGQE